MMIGTRTALGLLTISWALSALAACSKEPAPAPSVDSADQHDHHGDHGDHDHSHDGHDHQDEKK